MTTESTGPEGHTQDYQGPEAKKPESMGCLAMAIVGAVGVGALWLLALIVLENFVSPLAAVVLLVIPLAMIGAGIALRTRVATLSGLILMIAGITLLLTVGVCRLVLYFV